MCFNFAGWLLLDFSLILSVRATTFSLLRFISLFFATGIFLHSAVTISCISCEELNIFCGKFTTYVL